MSCCSGYGEDRLDLARTGPEIEVLQAILEILGKLEQVNKPGLSTGLPAV